MGSGKSYWGKIWSEARGFRFFDLDELIEQQEQKTITEIFESKGEAYFRKIETVILKSLVQYDHCIIATGGGAACYDDNLIWMNQNGKTVYLKATPFKLFENINTEIDKRPLFKKINKAEILFFIEQKLKERNVFYEAAQMTLPVSENNESTITDIISS